MSEVATTTTSKQKSWLELKSLTEYYRKISSSLNNDIPLNITFYPVVDEHGQKEYRVYYLASGTSRRETTIKYVNIKSNQKTDVVLNENLLFSMLSSIGGDKTKLTKEEQLLRERQRCSFNGITSYVLDDRTGRLVFSERSELYYFDTNQTLDTPIEVGAFKKGAIDFKICPYDANLVSYILNGDIWVKNLKSNIEVRLTTSEENTTSGVPSYIVQEEFDRYTGYWWQPVNYDTNGDESKVTHRIVYEVVDENNVDLTYITPSCNDEFGYDSYRYPRAGTRNARLSLKMVEFNFDQQAKVEHKSMLHSFYELFDWYEYMVRAGWLPNGKFIWVQIIDRLQMHSAILLIPVEYFNFDNHDIEMHGRQNDLSNQILMLIEQRSDAWINVHDVMHVFNNQVDDTKLTIVTANDESKFLHLCHYTFQLDPQYFTCESPGVYRSISNTKTKLTDGDWCIEWRENVFVDEENNLVYFMAYKNPLESQLFVVSIYEPLKVKQLTPSGFSHSITMNSECTLFVSICSNLSTQNKAFVYQIINQKHGIDKINSSQISQIYCGREESFSFDVTTSSLSLVTPLQSDIKVPQIFTFQTSDNCTLYGMIYLPNNYTPGVKYPTVLYVYGGPRVQLISNSYKANKFIRLNTLSLLGYCVVVIDSRGSDYRGLEFESHLRHKMGTVEIQDQVEGLHHASNTYQCIDMSRVAIFGWSYGGYMALMGLAQRPDIFKLAISGAPVTTWELYDTGYTERYMGLPNVNVEAYENGSVLHWAKKFPNEENRLLIIHGMIDENVHFAHTRRLIDALIKESKPYSLQVYPNERHGIRTPEASIHCDLNMYSFLERHI